MLGASSYAAVDRSLGVEAASAMTPVMRAEDGISSVVCEGTGPAWLAAHPGIVHDLDALPGKLLVRVLRDVAVEGAQDVVPRLDQLDVHQVLQGKGLLLSEQHCIWRKVQLASASISNRSR